MSDRIKYRYDVTAMARPENQAENCGGSFVEINIGEILDIENGDIPQIVDMKAGTEEGVKP